MSLFHIRTSEGKGAAYEARIPCSPHNVTRYGPTIRPPCHWQCPKAQTQLSTCTGTGRASSKKILRRQLGLQQVHSLLNIHARVRIGDPRKVLLYLLRDLLQTLR